MKIESGRKYKVLTDFHLFKEDREEEGSIFFTDEVHKLDFLFDRNGRAFVHLIMISESNGGEVNRTIGLEIFKQCFIEIEE